MNDKKERITNDFNENIFTLKELVALQKKLENIKIKVNFDKE